MQSVTNESELGLSDNKIVAIKFFAEWCGPCKTMVPNVKKLENEFSDVKFFEVDIDEAVSIASKYKVTNLPTIILLKNGKEVERVTGMQTLPALKKAFQKVVQ